MNKDPNIKIKVGIIIFGVVVATTVILLSILKPELFGNDENIKKEQFEKKESKKNINKFPKTKKETKILLDQLVTQETTTYVMGEEGNHDYPLSSMCVGSEEYNSEPDALNNGDLYRSVNTTYATGEDGMPITNVLTSTVKEEGTHNLPCNRFVNDIGGLGSF